MSRTPLSRMLAEQESRPDAQTAFRTARRAFLAGHRLDMQELASELGVSRATVLRWVGGKDQLVSDIIWSITVPMFQTAVDDAR
jgi:plasmid maintenance system antidote protein VapI